MLLCSVLSCICLMPSGSTIDIFIGRIVLLPLFCFYAGIFSAASDGVKRHCWLKRELYCREEEILRSKLEDLLPPVFVARTLDLSARPPCDLRWAAVLQLDIVGFTAMCQTLPPLQVLSGKIFCQLVCAALNSKRTSMSLPEPYT